MQTANYTFGLFPSKNSIKRLHNQWKVSKLWKKNINYTELNSLKKLYGWVLSHNFCPLGLKSENWKMGNWKFITQKSSSFTFLRISHTSNLKINVSIIISHRELISDDRKQMDRANKMNIVGGDSLIVTGEFSHRDQKLLPWWDIYSSCKANIYEPDYRYLQFQLFARYDKFCPVCKL